MIPPNLLINPGAETSNTVGWDQTSSTNTLIDVNGTFNAGYLPRTGSYCFVRGIGHSSASGLVQNVKLSDGVQNFTEFQLDAGSLKVELSFYYQTLLGFATRHDLVVVTLIFRSPSSIVNSVNSGELACTTSSPGWCHYIDWFDLPRNTRSIDYRMEFIRRDFIGVGKDIDSYVDDNSLKII